MNLLWVAAIMIFVFLEKVLPDSNWSARIGWLAGIGLTVSGLGVLVVAWSDSFQRKKSPSF